jgi:hypothetical protein
LWIVTDALLQALQFLIPAEQTVKALSELAARRVKVIAVPEGRLSLKPRCTVLHSSREKDVNNRRFCGYQLSVARHETDLTVQGGHLRLVSSSFA